jgi:F-type H+-transporting ATPase subunit delta
MASVTSVYARAFADVVFDRRLDPAKVAGDANNLVALFAGSKDLREVWEAPSVPGEQKLRLLDAIAGREGIGREVRNFVAVLIDHRRISLLAAIVKQFELELNERMGFTEAEITSAKPLNADAKRELESQVEKLTGKKVRASYAQDDSLLGGAVVRIGSTIYDGSVKGQLERIREQLASGAAGS